MAIDIREAESFNAITFVLNNNIVNENGTPIEFVDHSFLIDPYLDNTEIQAIKKCAQIGWSTLSIIRSFHLARFAGANIIHTFPSRSITRDFVVPKVDPLIEKNPILKSMIGLDSRYLKQIGDRFIYYRGTWEQTEAISISASILINDEYDRSNPKVLRTYKSRLDDAKRENPQLGWEWRFSNPTVPGYGVDQLWQESDQKHWFVKCRHCGYDWYLKFPENIDFNRKLRICSRCHKEIGKEELKNGRWVKKYFNRDVSGYWISQMFVPWITAGKIIKDSEGDEEVFHNFTLGLPFVSKETGVTREVIIRCMAPGYNRRNEVAIGVDNGVEKHYVVGNRAGIFEYGKTKDWKDIENLRNKYNAYMVIDANPYPTIPMRLVNQYPGKVYIHYYQKDTTGMGVVRWDHDEGLVKSDRTKVIDAVVAELNAKDILFNLTSTQLEEFIYHCEQVYRQIEMSKKGIRRPVWKTIEGRPDHFLHALIYWRVAIEQTMGEGGIFGSDMVSTGKKGIIVNPDETEEGLDLRKVLEKANQPEQPSWKSI